MSSVIRSAAMAEPIDDQARGHLLRADGQEDLCFALWRPSSGARRLTALVFKLVLPVDGDREVHGNASFHPQFFERAIEEARASGCGLALMHSHPDGRGWQGMSRDDVDTEHGRAAAVYAATGHPLVGLTIAGVDGAWSARFWERRAPRVYERRDCSSVRVVGDRLRVTYYDHLAPPPEPSDEQVRTISSWGEKQQAHLARLKVGIVGAGSVGGFIGEASARTGIENVVVVDFDKIESKNLDRLCYATRDDVGFEKVAVLAARLRQVATAQRFEVEAIRAAVYDDVGFRAILDCDVIFSCVDRPWGRQVLNLIAYAHLIPVVDGGIAVRINRKKELVQADWRAHVATVGRRCLECLGQFDPAHVQMERQGQLDDPSYIQGLDADHVLKAGQNVFGFSMACASLQFLQFLALVVAPLDQSNPGAQRYHFVGGKMEPPEYAECDEGCLFCGIVAQGDHCAFSVTRPRCEGA